MPTTAESSTDGGTVEVTGTSLSETTGETNGSADESTGPAQSCEPGAIRCVDTANIEECSADGTGWQSERCPAEATCLDDKCATACDLSESTLGCAFFVQRPLIAANNDPPDAVRVVNPSDQAEVSVQLVRVLPGSAGESVLNETFLAPKAVIHWELTGDPGDPNTELRAGGMYRVYSDAPVAAFLVAPSLGTVGNDSALLLPDNMLGRNYVLAAYPPFLPNPKGAPTWFEAISAQDTNAVEWYPTQPTALGVGIGAVAAGSSGNEDIDTYRALRIVAGVQSADLSGTRIATTKPTWLFGGTRCGHVPATSDSNGFCDPLFEVAIPVEHWGHDHIAAAPPPRDDEHHVWRVYAGAPTTIHTDPSVLNTTNCPDLAGDECPLADAGQWIEIESGPGESFVVSADPEAGSIMLVGYLASRSLSSNIASTDIGDSAVFQTIHPEAWLDTYAVADLPGFALQYIQVIRHAGGATVFLDGRGIAGMTTVGGFEYANVELGTGVATLESSDPFAVVQLGYTDDTPGTPGDPACMDPGGCFAGYAHPAGYRIPRLE